VKAKIKRPLIKTPSEWAAFQYGVKLAAARFEEVVARIERKLDRMTTEVMFSTRHTNHKRSTGVR